MITTFDELFPGKYLKGEDLDGPTDYTITGVARETIEGTNGTASDEAVVTLTRDGKPAPKLIMNITNGRCVRAMFGNVVAEWVGQRITLFPKKGVWFGEPGVALRVLGSPDLVEDMTIRLKVARGKFVQYTLRATGTAPEIPPESEQGAMTDAELEELY